MFDKTMWHNLDMTPTPSEQLQLILASADDDQRRISEALEIYRDAFKQVQAVWQPVRRQSVGATSANLYSR